MILTSVNKADAQTVKWRSKNVKTGIFKLPVDKARIVENGLEADNVVDKKYHGGKDMQIYAYSFDHYNYWKELYPDLKFRPGMFGENLTIEGLDESQICIGDEWRIGKDVIIQVTQPRQPCFKLGIKFGNQNIIKQFINAPYPGVYFRILNTGTIQKGDEVKLVKRNTDLAFLDVWNALYSDSAERQKIVKMIHEDYLAAEVRTKLKKRLK